MLVAMLRRDVPPWRSLAALLRQQQQQGAPRQWDALLWRLPGAPRWPSRRPAQGS
jgi:hypothetical protein